MLWFILKRSTPPATNSGYIMSSVQGEIRRWIVSQRKTRHVGNPKFDDISKPC
jgi:hypothetical protein